MKLGITLAGGMAKGAYQIGALKAIEQYVPRSEITAMSCASIGVLNGYAYATDQLDTAKDMWLDMCSRDENYFITQVLMGDYLQKVIQDIYREEDYLERDFYVSLLELSSLKISYKNLRRVKHENVVEYLKAAVSMPICNMPMRVGRALYYDGAMVDNIPVFPLKDRPMDYMFCVYFDDNNYTFENRNFDSRIVKIIYPHKTFIRQSLFFNRASIEEMITDGYDQTSYLLDSVLAKGIEDTEYIYKAIAMHNLQLQNQKMRVTGDVIVTNMNKVVQKLVRRKILK